MSCHHSNRRCRHHKQQLNPECQSPPIHFKSSLVQCQCYVNSCHVYRRTRKHLYIVQNSCNFFLQRFLIQGWSNPQMPKAYHLAVISISRMVKGSILRSSNSSGNNTQGASLSAVPPSSSFCRQ